MKRLLLFSLLLWGVTLSPIDRDTALIQHVRELLKTSPSTRSFVYRGDGLFEFESTDGTKWFRRFTEDRPAGGLQPKKIITIDLRFIDTTGFSTLLHTSAEIPLGLSYEPLIGSHLIADSITEVTGRYVQIGLGDLNRIFQRFGYRDSFRSVFVLEHFFWPFGASNIDKNGGNEILGDSSGSIFVFENVGTDTIDMTLKYLWSGGNGGAQVPRITDLDSDGYPEVLIQQFGNGFFGTKIVKYRSGSDRLESVYKFQIPNMPGFRGYWAVGDFDLDGHGEFATANAEGVVYVIEHVAGDTAYAVRFTDTTRNINAYFHTEGNDLDGDGRPELLIGSDDTNGRQTIAVYETTGDNRFEVSVWIELYPLGTFVWPWIWTGDVTGDGHDEIVLACSGTLIILEATADDDYRVLWYRRYESEISQRLFDVDGDGKQEILLSMAENDRRFTKILSYARPTPVEPVAQLPMPGTLTMYPSPATNAAMAEYTSRSTGILPVSVYASSGALAYRTRIASSVGSVVRFPIPTAGWAPGVYFLTVQDGTQTASYKLLVVK